MTASAVIVSIVLALIVLFAVGLFNVAQNGCQAVQAKLLETLGSGSTGITVRVGSVDGTLMKAVVARDVSVFMEDKPDSSATANPSDESAHGDPFALVQEIEVSSSFWSILKAALGFGSHHLNVSVYNPTFSITDSTIAFLEGLVGNARTEDGTNPADADMNATAAGGGAFQGVSATINVYNASLALDMEAFDVGVSGINASASFGNGFELEGADLNVPSMQADIHSVGLVGIEDVRVSIEKDLDATASIGNVSMDDYETTIRNVSAIAKTSEGMANVAFFVQEISSGYMGYDVSLLDAIFNLDMDLASLVDGIEFVCSLPYASFQSSKDGLSVGIEGTNLTGIASRNGVGLDVSSTYAKVETNGLSIALDRVGLNVDSSPDLEDLTASRVLGSITAIDVDVVGIPKEYLDKAGVSNMEIDVSMQDGFAELRFKTHAKGSSPNEFIGDFSTDIDANLSLSLEGSITHAGAQMSNIMLAALPKKADASFSYDAGKSANLTLSVIDDIDGSVDISFDTNEIETKFYLDGVRPSQYDVVYRKLLSSQEFVMDDTSFDGSIVLSVGLPDELGSVESVFEGNWGGLGVFAEELAGSGRVSMNIAIHDLNVDGSPYSGALSFEAALDGTVLEVGTLAVTTGDYRVSYAGSIDYNDLVPDGMLTLQNAADGSELARLEFNSIEGTKLYSFALTSPISRDSSVRGTLDWQDEDMITASAVLEAGILSDGRLPFNVTVVKFPLSISVESESLSLNAEISSQSVLTVAGSLTGLSVKASDALDVKVGMDIDMEYDIISGSLDATLSNLYVGVSDILGFGFNAHLTDNKLEAYDISVEREGYRTLFNGGLDLSFDTIADAVSFDPARLEATLDILDEVSSTYAKGNIIDGNYYLDARINSILDIAITLLGSKNHGFHANGSVDWADGSNGFSFKSQYRDGRLGFYDSTGRIGGLDLNEVGMTIDFNEMSMEFLLSFKNTVEKFAEDNSMQSGTIALSGRLETITSGLLSAVAGLDTDLSFELSFRDFQLEDGFGIPDTSVGILYSKGVVSFDGELISGVLDTANGYIDIHVDKSFLFGFDAKGYVGDELDITVSNIYVPLPLVNQFVNLLLMGFSNGEITGDVLIKGPVEDPRFYGMLYCQLFEMWMVYLPGQSLVVNNIAITLQDHSITIPKTPYSGHSTLDGRFLNGTVGVSIDVQSLGIGNMEVNLDVQTPIDLWVPLPLDSNDLEIRGDAVGQVVYALRNGSSYLECDVTASNMLVDFRIEDRPKWLDMVMEPINMDITLTTGNDVEFCYPEKNNAFIDFTLNEGETIKAIYEMDTKRIETSGSLSFKTGQVYYFQNDFYISEGSLDLTPRKFGTSINGISFLLNLSARLKDYDSSGNKVEVNLILQNATLDNITPRFTSTPNMSETEIIALLGQTILPSSTFDQQVSVASVASLAAAATEAFTRLGIIESNSSYSLSGTVRDSLGLDIFSLRSSILQNIIIDALPGDVSGRSDISLLSKYLDGTSVFAGSYIMPGVFAQTSLRLKADRSGGRNSNLGHFLSNDLILDMEFSIDWDNPMGTFTIFTKPQELSPFSILDSIGFSVTKRIQF